MTYRVSITPRAADDLDGVLSYLSKRSPQGAEAWFREWLRVFVTLKMSAENQQLAPENADHLETIRQVIFKTRRGNPYRCLFLIRGQIVHVLHIRGYGQDLVAPEGLTEP